MGNYADTRLTYKLHFSRKGLRQLGRLLPLLFLIAMLITNTRSWLNGGPWYSTVLNLWLLAVWIAVSGMICVVVRK